MLGHRTRWFAAGRFQRGVGIGTFRGYKMAYRLRSADEHVLAASFDKDLFLAAIPDYRLPGDATVLDVGAHIGTFAVFLAKKAPRGRVFAIEASRETCALLRINSQLNGTTNVVVDHLALAGQDGVIDLHHDPDGNWGHSITRNFGTSSETVAASTLQTYLRTRDITSVNLAKFNCEGAEFPILLSTPVETLRLFDTMIILYHGDLVAETPARLLAHLTDCGFATRIINEDEHRGWIIANRR